MIKDRAIGALVGLAIGDSLGMPIEFSIRDTVEPITGMRAGGPFNLNIGEWTDDTSMALCLAETIIETGTIDKTNLMDKFKKWFEDGYNSHTNTCFDIGSATRNAIMGYRTHGNPVAGGTEQRSSGNGSIMRLSPVPIRWHNNIDLAKKMAIEQSITTHGSQECTECSEQMSEVIVNFINTGDINTLPNIDYMKNISRHNISSSGYVIDTWLAARWSIAKTTSFKDAVLLAVNLGDDSDTVGAVTGQLAGALYGYSSIPEEWIDVLVWHNKIYDLAEKLYNGGNNE